MGLPKPCRETKFSGTKNGAREIFVFPVQLTTSRIGNLTLLILILAIYAFHLTGTICILDTLYNITLRYYYDNTESLQSNTLCTGNCTARLGCKHIKSYCNYINTRHFTGYSIKGYI